MTRTGTWTTPVGERALVLACAAIVFGLLAAPAAAQPPCPIGTVLATTVALVDTEPAIPNSIIIHPDGSGQTLASRGLTIDVCVTCSGAPLVGAPATEFTLTGPGIYICGLGSFADGPTDAAGCTTFTGTIVGGGCGGLLGVNVGGALAGVVGVAIRSPDGPGISPGYIDAGDLAFFASAFPSALGSPTFNPCVDYNTDAFVDASDLSWFASVLGLVGTACP